MDFGPEILREFVVESREHFENIEEDILQLFRQKDSPERERIDKIFRSVHTVKGAAGFLQLDQIGKLAHVMETVLSMLRAGEIKPEKEVTDALLEGVDLLNAMLENVEQSNDYDISKAYNHLSLLLEKTESSQTQIDLKSDIYLQNLDKCGTGFTINKLALKNLPSDYKFLYILQYDLVKLSKSQGESPVSLIRKLLKTGEILDSKIEACSRDLSEGLPIGPLKYFVLYSTNLEPDIIHQRLRLSQSSIIPIDKEKLMNMNGSDSLDINAVLTPSFLPEEESSNISCKVPVETEKWEDSPTDSDSPEEESSDISCKVPVETEKREETPTDTVSMTENRHNIRVELDKLDLLINLVGELVIAESMVTNHPELAGLELEDFDRSAQNLKRIINELQDVAMSMRMIPLSKTFKKTMRLVHDLSGKFGKNIKLELIGEETEVDKTVIENIGDPLLHIIRNCIDHGIGSPEQRKAAGKSETGNITIEAKHEGGEVLIRISDDGRGLNREKILKKGIKSGLINDNGETLSDQEVYRLIFEPGFSTANKITDISGRGVGMDVVKKSLEKLKGDVDIRSIPGKGTTIILRIPLTLAIIDGMLIRVGSANYTIPLLSIRESFRPTPEQITITMDGQEIVRIRDDLIPILRLHQLYNITPEHRELEQGILIHVAAGSKNVCLFVDEILGHLQTVIKGIPNYIASARGISGCTILGNGDVSLILDVRSIIEGDR